MRKKKIQTIRCILIATIMVGLPYQSVLMAHKEDETLSLTEKTSLSLNVRLSSRTIQPPKELIKEVIQLKGIRAARPRVGPPPQSAIIEDDKRRRYVILSLDELGNVIAYVLEDLDLKANLSKISICTQEHHCEEDRMAVTGGLGCIAVCVKDALEQ